MCHPSSNIKMGPSHAGVFSQVNRKKTSRESSTVVLGASHSSSQSHQVFILSQERVGREMNSPGFGHGGLRHRTSDTLKRRNTQRVQEYDPKSTDDPRHLAQNAVRYNLARMHAWRSAGAVCPSDEHSCHSLDDKSPPPIVFSASIGKIGSRSRESGAPGCWAAIYTGGASCLYLSYS